MTGTTRHQLRSRMPRGYFDNLAPSETAESWETRAGDSAQGAHASANERAQFAGPNSGKSDAGSGEPGVSLDTARDAVPAGENLPGGMDTRPVFGIIERVVRVAGGGVRSHAAGNPEISQQLRAARLLRL